MLDDHPAVRRKCFIAAPRARFGMLPVCEQDASRAARPSPRRRKRIDEEWKVNVTFAASEPPARSGVPMRDPSTQRRIGAALGEIVAAPLGLASKLSARGLPGRGPSRLPVALGIGLAIILVACALARPEMILRLLPRLAPAYAAVGMRVNLRGFEFEHVSARFEDVGGTRSLAIEGVLRNIAPQPRDAPRLRVTLSDIKARPVYFWTTSSGVKALAPGETAPFRARLAAPPLEAQAVTVDFTP
jgi:hypothetical protein